MVSSTDRMKGDWGDPAHVQKLRELWNSPRTILQISQKLSRETGCMYSQNSVANRARALGLPKKQAGSPNAKPSLTLGANVTNDVAHCEWRIDRADGHGSDPCGKPAVKRKPYCEKHCNVAYRPPDAKWQETKERIEGVLHSARFGSRK